ncbi:MAG: hypothetical protein PHN72_03815 [Bacilli bacterium]|nr:hypothetical protein [Bacilli bacterium]
MKNKIVKEIKQLKGFVLGIGLDETLEDALYANENIHKCDLISNMKSGSTSIEKGTNKTISIYKLKKKYKKNKVDYIICNVEDVEEYMKYFLRDGTYIVKNKIYLYGNLNKINIEDFSKVLKRYDFVVKIEKNKKEYLLTLQKNQCHYSKNYFYFLVDGFLEYVEKISSFLEK